MKFLIASIIGGIIGYLTNWIAIKMLFRPYEEKRIFGMKVPFTPGLIPKEKTRIAKSVGNAIGEHLLSSEIIVKSLCSENMNNRLKIWIRQKVYSLITTKKTLEDKFKEFLDYKYDYFINALKASLSKLTINNLKNEKNRDKVKQIIKIKLDKILSLKGNHITNNYIYKQIKRGLINNTNEYLKSNNFKEVLKSLIIENIKDEEVLNKKIGNIIPNNFTSNIKVYVYRKKDNLSNYINEMLKEEGNINKLKNILREVINNNVNSFMSMFIDVNAISDKTIVFLEGYLQREETKEEMVSLVNKSIDKILDTDLQDIIENIPENNKDVILNETVDILCQKFQNTEMILEMIEKIESHFQGKNSLNDIIEKININPYKFINSIIDKFIDSENFEAIINNLISDIIENFMKTPIYELTQGNEEGILNTSYQTVKNVYNRFIENQAEEVISILDISSIVEDRINEFDVYLAEEIILEISSKELKAITWLGGLLGALIGILSPILSKI
ncbi:DUF445 family protein [Clostridium botulinum]|uniref:Membrane protein n=1 Tax=Clostridium botulinum (strain Hall / ATCC 3502 / NCTC 13319 / Type A) TaxID=441771 RepID=A5HXX3_CLOBH|nr:DUF445 family protein [Clostridium botulinum]ABS33526.1 conserved hypothetical protein [Clostridium botulinum A str. ATCC 19397]ABS38996.1 conserved hypothetical protein [Clostridium botulinum A str. Hall]AWB15999.1 DUF445 domain-containing protein [Clostridium botulinum]AWB28817.1 DUF445 domain-containing protein [Clostridium botulinum]EGT5615207.1 DUF445 family protein [Clostridium botulinum]